MLASKVYESYVLDWLKAEVRMRTNQFGGVKGLGTNHVLFLYWQEILSNLEDYRAGTVITSIDYAKAFNRMSFQHCLTALAKKGASTPLLRLVATFLTNRTMTVKVGQTLSNKRPVQGGCPQGSILGVFLFNCTIDDLESGCQDVKDSLVYNPVASDNSCDSSLDDVELPTLGNAHTVCSTPTRSNGDRPTATESPILGLHQGPRRQQMRPLELSFEARQDVPDEVNHWTEAKWQASLAALLRFVDDGFTLAKVNFENSVGYSVNGVQYRVKHAIQSQNIFRHMVREAEHIGMKVNTNKTAMTCVSDALSYVADAYILDRDGNRIGCQDSMKVLGMRFSNRPNMDSHVAWIKTTMRQRFWILRNLQNSGFTEQELIQVYKTILRPVLDYAAVIYHPSLTEEQDLELERLQNQALKCVCGPQPSAREMRERAQLPTVRQRREEMCLKFARKLSEHPLFEEFFPKKTARASRRGNPETFLEKKARCDRMHNSPLFYYRRILNDKPGKTYGNV